VSESILTSVKKVLGIAESYTAFDDDIIMHINSALSTLNQLGVGPENGLAIANATPTWAALIGTDARYNLVRSYVFLRVKMLFDPPPTSFHLEAVQRQIQEFEWRINTYREETGWVDPSPPPLDPDFDPVLDGGTP